MSLFFKPQSEQRAASGLDWVRDMGSGSSTRAGVSVTQGSSLQLGAMWSSANLLASIVSNFPVDVFRGSGASKTPVTSPPPLVVAPSLIVSRREWVYQSMMSMLLRGNAYGYIVEHDSLERPKIVEWLNPDDVAVTQESALSRPTYTVGGQPVSRDDLIHMRAFLKPGSAAGMSPVEYHAEMIGVGLAAQRFGAQWFGDGGHPTAIFKNSAKTLDDTQTESLKRRIMAVLKGKREPLVLGSDWDYSTIQVSPNESQFIETMGYTDAQVARLYGPGIAEILGYGSSGGSLTYSNRVDRSLDLLTYSVMPWVTKFEDMWTASIAQPQTARMNVSALLRVDPKAQREIFRTDREIGLHSIDELRDLLDEPPLPGDEGNDYTPLKSSGTATPPPSEGQTDGN